MHAVCGLQTSPPLRCVLCMSGVHLVWICTMNLCRMWPTCWPVRLRREYQIGGGIPVLLSTEKPRCQLVSMVDLDGANPLDYQVGVVQRVRLLLKHLK